MDGDRFVVSARENPRTLGFAPERAPVGSATATTKPMSNEISQKPPVPIVDRFKALLKQREDEVRVLSGDNVPSPTTEEIVRLYEIVLSELIFNSKPIITDLTIIAGDHKEHGDGIADAICARIVEVCLDMGGCFVGNFCICVNFRASVFVYWVSFMESKNIIIFSY